MLRPLGLLSIFPILTAAGLAHADDLAPPLPLFAGLGFDGAASEVAVDLGISIPTEDDADGQLYRLTLGGQFVDPRTGAGGYAAISMARLTENDGQSAIGNLELGGVVHRALRPDLDAAARIGLILPTGSEGEDVLVNVVGALVQDPSDIAAALPETTFVRIAAAPTYHQGGLYVRADLGVDIPIDGEGAEEFGSVIHADVALGFANDQIGGAVALQTARVVDLFGEGDDEWFHLASVNLQRPGERAIPYLGISVPLGDDLDAIVNITGGVHGRF